MCNLDIYERTRIYKPMLIIGALLTLTSTLMISLGIGRARPDVWIAGILVAIAGGPLFLFSTMIFCMLNRPSDFEDYEQGFDISRLNYPYSKGPASFNAGPYGYMNQSQLLSNPPMQDPFLHKQNFNASQSRIGTNKPSSTIYANAHLNDRIIEEPHDDKFDHAI
ncbi:hypothetical protein Ciccas_010074 [Cichlidogyrus casuarinus]|uniref:Uncharacterized protein n=1 Tax=Cichlidogyrus casuarinus TaxID=1844966 RepID=A0ABD2PWR0_9PLAT